MLKGDKIHLRRVESSDLEELFWSDEDAESRGRHTPLTLRSLNSLTAMYEQDGMWSEQSGTMVMVENAKGRLVGSIFHFKTPSFPDAVEIGYTVFRPEDRSKGYTTEAVKLFCTHLFETMAITRIQIQVEPDNLASLRVGEKCGFQYEGLAENEIMSRNGLSDVKVLSLKLPQLLS